MKVDTIIEAINDSYFEVIDPLKLKRRIADAVRHYSRFNPAVTTYSFETVYDNAAYELPSDFLAIRDLEYWPSGIVPGITEIVDTAITQQQSAYSYDLISEPVISSIKRSQYAKWHMGTATVEGRQLILHPTPTQTGLAVTLKYAAPHKLTDDSDYETIPEEDLSIIRDLVVADLMEARRVQAAALPDYREGLTEIRRGEVAANVASVVASLRARCSDKYTNPVVAV